MTEFPALRDFAERERERRMQLAVLGIHDAIGLLESNIREARPFTANRLRRDREKLVRLVRNEARHDRFGRWADELTKRVGLETDELSPAQWRRIGLDYMSGMTAERASEIWRVVDEANARIGGAA